MISVLIVLIACVLVSPAMAGTKYLSGGPSLSAAVTGTNELISGQTVPLQVTIENSGLIDSKFSQTGLVDRTDLPNTAKTVTVGLGADDAPVTIQSDPQMIGDILGGASGQAKFNVKIEADALTHAEEEIRILSCWKLIKNSIIPMLTDEIERNVKIEVATDRWEGEVPLGMVVRIKKPPIGHDRFEKDAGGGLILIDQQKVLAVTNALKGNPTALYSESEGFVKLFMQFWNNIIEREDDRDQ